MSLAFTDILTTDVEAGLQRRFPALVRLFDGHTPAILYPAGRMARGAAPKLRERGVSVAGFGDSNSALWDTMLDGLPVFSPKQIVEQHLGSSLLVSTSMYDSEVCETLRRCGCRSIYPMPWLHHCLPDVFVSREYDGGFEAVVDPKNHDAINAAYDLLADDESRRTFAKKIEYLVTFDKRLLDEIRSSQPIYFDRNIVPISDHEVVLDGGAFTGDTLGQFLTTVGRSFDQYHAFEPDAANFSRLHDTAANDPRIYPVRAGLAGETGELRFLSTAYADATFAMGEQQGGDTVPVTTIDLYVAGRRTPTFVKMDIEGFEQPALRGAANLIASEPPVLAVSAYHYASDLWTIPLLIHELNPSYRLAIRHYTREIDDTVCYAVPQTRKN